MEDFCLGGKAAHDDQESSPSSYPTGGCQNIPHIYIYIVFFLLEGAVPVPDAIPPMEITRSGEPEREYI